jgi:hypothetical protein
MPSGNVRSIRPISLACSNCAQTDPVALDSVARHSGESFGGGGDGDGVLLLATAAIKRCPMVDIASQAREAIAEALEILPFQLAKQQELQARAGWWPVQSARRRLHQPGWILDPLGRRSSRFSGDR